MNRDSESVRLREAREQNVPFMNLYQVAEEISRRLANIFLRDKDGRRPVWSRKRSRHGETGPGGQLAQSK
jgi:hypothetical protein